MVGTEKRPLSPHDPLVSLATMLHGQPGTYALLIGSGASTGAGLPTGWGIVEDLVRKVAAVSGAPLSGSDDWEAWWAENSGGQELGYSALLESIAPTASARKALLASYFEPNEADREAGQKTPSEAHHAIAELVANGLVRVIVTTNFDRLIEQSLEARGIQPQVVSNEASVQGMEPLQHARVTVFKIHGDYSSIDQRNTKAELSTYPKSTRRLLKRIFDEYGLIVCGWSGEWDPALVRQLQASSNRRYPLYWTSFGDSVASVAKELTARNGAHVITNVSADSFFPDLLDRVQALETMAESPISTAMKIARLKRALPNPASHLKVRELFEDELDLLFDAANRRAKRSKAQTIEGIEEDLEEVFTGVRTMLALLTAGIRLDKDRLHDDLWVWAIQRALNFRLILGVSSDNWWNSLMHYPALLMYRAAVIAAISAKREDLIITLSREPKWRAAGETRDAELLCCSALNLSRVLIEKGYIEALPRWGGTRFFYPASKLVRDHLRDIALELADGGDTNYLFDQMEYRIALATHLLKRTYRDKSPSAEEYLGEKPWNEEEKKDFWTELGPQVAVSEWHQLLKPGQSLEDEVANLGIYLHRISRD